MDLLIVGAGGMGRETYTWLTHEIQNKKQFHVKGFLDDNLGALDNYSYPVSVIGTISSYQPKANESLVIAIAYPDIKKKVVTELEDKGANFHTLIHPTAIIGTNTKVGKGCVISPYCVITNDTVIGNFVICNCNATIGHDITIGDYSLILGKVEIAGNVKIGSSCFIGVGAKIIQNCIIGDNAIIGAGGVVISEVPSKTTVAGVPAKIINKKSSLKEEF